MRPPTPLFWNSPFPLENILMHFMIGNPAIIFLLLVKNEAAFQELNGNCPTSFERYINSFAKISPSSSSVSLLTDNYYILHHPHHPPGIVRMKGPSGLKFCMRPHLTMLTTTLQNFNPENFFGGSSPTTNPGMVRKKGSSAQNVGC